MPLTSEERAQINRNNARKSTGPKTAEGKARASRNALKHGLRAEAFALSPEETEELKTLTDEWVDYYQPETPGLRATLDRCVLSVVQQKRCATFQAARVGQQVREAEERFDQDQQDQLDALVGGFPHDPETAVRLMKRLASGCRWLIAHWEGLKERLDANGCWTARGDFDKVLRLMGKRPDMLRIDPEVYELRLFNLLAQEAPNEGEIAWIRDPKQVPESLHFSLTFGLPSREDSIDALRALLDQNLGELKAREERLRTKIEEPNRAGAGDRALLLMGPEGALFIRYEKMHDAAFHKAYKALLKGEAAVAPNEARPAEVEPAAAPNEAEEEPENESAEPELHEIKAKPARVRTGKPSVPAVNASTLVELTRPIQAEAA